MSPQSFILSHRKGFLRALRNGLGVKVKDVVIISVQPAEVRKRSVRGGPALKTKPAKPKTEKKKKTKEGKEPKEGGRSARQLTLNDLDVLFAVRNGSYGILPADRVSTFLH